MARPKREEPDTDRERALAKTTREGAKLTGETLRVEMVLEVPVDKNWLLGQQIIHLLDDLSADASMVSFLRDVKFGWGWRKDDPRQDDLDQLGEGITVTVHTPLTNSKEYKL